MEGVTGGWFDYPAGHGVAQHVHDRDQLVYAAAGVIRATADDSHWTLSPQRALHIPAGTSHGHVVPVAASMATLLMPASPGPSPPRTRLLAVTPLTRELLLSLVNGSFRAALAPSYLAVLHDQLASVDGLTLDVPLPPDGTPAAIVTATLWDHPDDPATLPQWGRRVGASGRTLARDFRAGTGLTFGQWRRRLRIARSLEHLTAGKTVEATAHRVGYATAAAFAHAFKALTGMTPAAAAAQQHHSHGREATTDPRADR